MTILEIILVTIGGLLIFALLLVGALFYALSKIHPGFKEIFTRDGETYEMYSSDDDKL